MDIREDVIENDLQSNDRDVADVEDNEVKMWSNPATARLKKIDVWRRSDLIMGSINFNETGLLCRDFVGDFLFRLQRLRSIDWCIDWFWSK